MTDATPAESGKNEKKADKKSVAYTFRGQGTSWYQGMIWGGGRAL
jgi:hypothetical protein